MKFTDGQWMTRPGFELVQAMHPHDVRAGEAALDAYASPRDLTHRGARLDLPLLTVRFSSPMKNVIRVQAFRHKGVRERTPSFELFANGEPPVETGANEDEAWLISGELSVRVRRRGSWAVDFYDGNRRLTGSRARSLAHITGADGTTYVREELDLGVGECVYGLGERFTPFVKNGQTVDIWNRDGGTSTEQAYKNVPFYLTNRGYGVFVNHPELVSFEVGSEKVSKVQFSVAGERLDYFIIGGGSPKAVVETYTALTGKPALPPAWSFGLWLTTSFTTDYDEATVNSFVDGMRERDVPLHVFHFDCFWMEALHWTDFQWDRSVFPDPEGMLRRLKDKGLKICVWINPYIAQQSCLFDEGMAKGYFVRRPNGDVWQWDRWQPGMALVDFTNPEAWEWFASHLRRLVDMGVDSFKTDFGERIPTDVVYDDGSDPEKMHNYYTFLYNKCVFETLEQKLGKGEATLFARSATAGGQRFPVHWGGDCSADYESMAESLRGGLSLGLSGFGFWSHDIGGFESTAPADLYKRWAAFGLLSTHSRLHGNQSYRVPWLYDQEAVDVMSHFTRLKCSLMPYLFDAAAEAAERGIPVMRAMMLEFPEDPAADYLDRQYMLGSSLLVAPVFSETGDVSFYLPQGRWTHFLSGETVRGGTWRKEKHDYFSLPLYVRENSIIAVGPGRDRPDYDFADGVELHIFELADGGTARAIVRDLRGAVSLRASASRSGRAVTVSVEGPAGKRWSVLLRGVKDVAAVRGGTAAATPLGVRLTPDAGAAVLEIGL